MSTGAAIEKRERASLGFMAKDLSELWRVSEMLAQAGLIPTELRGKPFDVQVILMTGHDLGLTYMQSLREVYVVHGRGFISSDLKVALVLQSGVCEYWNDVTDPDKKSLECIIETKRKGARAPVRHKFTVEQAKAANLFKNDIWSKYTSEMLLRRCSSQLANRVYPDIVRGMGTSDDEMLEVKGEATRVPLTSAPPSPVVGREQPLRPASASVREEPVADADLVDEDFDQTTGEVKDPAPPASVAQTQPSSGGATEAEAPAPRPSVATDAAPSDPLEVELRSLEQAIEAAKTRDELKSLVDRLKALPTHDQTQMRVRYTAKSRSLPA